MSVSAIVTPSVPSARSDAALRARFEQLDLQRVRWYELHFTHMNEVGLHVHHMLKGCHYKPSLQIGLNCTKPPLTAICDVQCNAWVTLSRKRHPRNKVMLASIDGENLRDAGGRPRGPIK
eukprot:1625357-Pleurochrysis_carterae.AAC.1